MMTRTLNLVANRWTIALIAGSLVGCSLQEDTLQQALDKAQKATAGQNSLFTSLSTDGQPTDLANAQGTGVVLARNVFAPGDPLEPAAASEPVQPTVPYPDRTNPFDFADGIDFEAPQVGENEELEIKLFGFIGTDRPKAIVNVSGRTKVLEAGEKWGVLEILEVTPPTVRIKSNGVARVWSLLGHHQENKH